MNTAKHFKIWKILPVLTLIFMSCSDFLTVSPSNRTEENGYYNSAQRIEQAVIGGYVDLRRALLSNYAWLMYGEARAGDLTVKTDFQTYVASQQLNFNQYDLQQLTDWGYFYDAIKSANDVLAIVGNADTETLTDYQRKLYKGESLALKSIAYFYLARIWGDVPSAEAADFGQKLTSAAVVERAITYASEARTLLPWILLNDDEIQSSALTAVRFSKTTATLLLAQEQLWLAKGTEAQTTLTELFADGASLSGFSLSLGTDRRTTLPTAPLSAVTVSMPLSKLNSIYPDGDQRRTSLFTISASAGTASLIVKDQSALELFRLGEQYLLLAEAAWRAGKLEEAKQHLVTAAKGATEDYTKLTESEFRDALLKERQRILVGTGQRFFDLARLGKVSSAIPQLPESAVQAGAAYWPLSARSLSGTSMSQNSYWAR